MNKQVHRNGHKSLFIFGFSRGEDMLKLHLYRFAFNYLITDKNCL